MTGRVVSDALIMVAVGVWVAAVVGLGALLRRR
jgi:hypothetical protein